MSAPAIFSRSFRTQTSPNGDAASSVFIEVLALGGHTETRLINNAWCAVRQFNYSTAVVVGIDEDGYQRRYCYEYRTDAQAALLACDGRGHPAGPWIKCKGEGIDLLNPALR